eukprot:1143551-Pyramimonas_sp.AAC.1
MDEHAYAPATHAMAEDAAVPRASHRAPFRTAPTRRSSAHIVHLPPYLRASLPIYSYPSFQNHFSDWRRH